MNLGYAIERLLLTLWVGSLWAIGYVAIPVAFMSIETLVAAKMAGQLINIVNVIGLVSATLLLLGKLFTVGTRSVSYWRFWLIIVMTILTAFLLLYLSPEMAAIKAIDGWREQTSLTEKFGTLHAISEKVYWILSILGLALVLTSDKKVPENRFYGA